MPTSDTGRSQAHEVQAIALIPPQPPRIEKVEAGWNAEMAQPQVRVFLERFEEKSTPVLERFTLAAGEETFGPAEGIPVAAQYEVYRQTGVAPMPGGLLSPAAAGSRLIRVGQTIDKGFLVLQNGGEQVVVRVIRERVLAPGSVELLLSRPLPTAMPQEASVFVPTVLDIRPFVSGDLRTGMFRLDRAAMGIPQGEIVVVLLAYREDEVEPGKWSVYIVRELPGLMKILCKEELSATSLQHRRAGQAGALFLDITLPETALARDWHGKHVAVGVSAHRLGDEADITESAITWIPGTLMVAPPRLEVVGVTHTAVRFRVLHPVAAPDGGRAGAMVYRFPDGSSLREAGFPLNRALVTGDLFADSETEPNRLRPGPPENGPRYLQSGDRMAYIASEMVESPYPLTTLRALERPGVPGEPYTEFVNAGQQAEVSDEVNRGDAAPPAPLATIVVLEPNGGEVWTVGGQQFVRWTTNNLVGLVSVHLSRDGGGSYSLLFDNVPHNAGEMEVLSVPGPPTVQARIMVRSKLEPTVLDTSDNVFEIRAGERWRFNEIPSGVIDGVNRIFTLSEVPDPPRGLLLFKNGQLQEQDRDYMLAGAVITFVPERIPQVGDTLVATYPCDGIVGNWDWSIVPSGAIDGVNRVFTLPRTPNPPISLLLFKNGQLQRQDVAADYTLAGAVITFVPERTPQVGDTLLATYPY